GSGEVHEVYEGGRKPVELLRLWRARRGVVHAPEIAGTTTTPVDADDHVLLLAILRAKVVLGHLATAGDFALHDEIVALPVSFDLDVSASLHGLLELAAIAVQHEGSARVGREGERRV